MNRKEIDDALQGILEGLAHIEHERWSHWQKYMHAKGSRLADGSLVIPGDLVAQWDRQIVTPYAELSEKEKESDRDQVRKYLSAIIEALSTK